MTDRISESSSLSASDRWTYSHQSRRAELTAESIAADFRHAGRFYRALLREHLPSDLNAPVLDLPCGEGQMVYVLRELGYRDVRGYDLDAGRLATGQKLGLPIAQADVFDELAKLPDGSVGAVFSMDFLEHLDKLQVVDYLTAVHRKLAPGGRFFVRTPCADSPRGASHVFNDFTHKWAATSGVLRALLTSANFEPVSVFGEHPRLAMSWGWLRVPLFQTLTKASNLLMRAMNLPPYSVWSPSMWGVGQKPR